MGRRCSAVSYRINAYLKPSRGGFIVNLRYIDEQNNSILVDDENFVFTELEPALALMRATQTLPTLPATVVVNQVGYRIGEPGQKHIIGFHGTDEGGYSVIHQGEGIEELASGRKVFKLRPIVVKKAETLDEAMSHVRTELHGVLS